MIFVTNKQCRWWALFHHCNCVLLMWNKCMIMNFLDRYIMPDLPLKYLTKCVWSIPEKKKENDIWKKKGQNYTENSTLKFVCLFVVATRKCWKSTLTNRVQLNNIRRVSHRLRIPKKHGNIILQSKLFNTQLITHFPLRRNCLKLHDLRFETKLQITYHIKRSCL